MMETFTLNGIEMPIATYNNHIDELTNKIYKVLCICEQCEEKGDFTPYFEYLYKTNITKLNAIIL